MIDFSPNNAPLKNLARPSLDDIARLRQTDAVARWSPPPPVSPNLAKRRNLIVVISCSILSLVLSWAAIRDTPEKPPWSERDDIRSIYVTVKTPSPALVKALQVLANRGVDVRIVSGHPLSVPGATVGVVAPARIEREGVMINGLSIYPLDL